MTDAFHFWLSRCLRSYEDDLVSGKRTLFIKQVAYLENRQRVEQYPYWYGNAECTSPVPKKILTTLTVSLKRGVANRRL